MDKIFKKKKKKKDQVVSRKTAWSGRIPWTSVGRVGSWMMKRAKCVQNHKDSVSTYKEILRQVQEEYPESENVLNRVGKGENGRK
jgi:hypothetical protein